MSSISMLTRNLRIVASRMINHISPLTNCRWRDKMKKKMSKKKVQNNNNTPLQKEYQHFGSEIPNNGSHVVFAIREGNILIGKCQDGKFIDSNNKLNVLSPEDVISYYYLKDLFNGALQSNLPPSPWQQGEGKKEQNMRLLTKKKKNEVLKRMLENAIIALDAVMKFNDRQEIRCLLSHIR